MGIAVQGTGFACPSASDDCRRQHTMKPVLLLLHQQQIASSSFRQWKLCTNNEHIVTFWDENRRICWYKLAYVGKFLTCLRVMTASNLGRNDGYSFFFFFCGIPHARHANTGSVSRMRPQLLSYIPSIPIVL